MQLAGTWEWPLALKTQPASADSQGAVYHLDSGLAAWAYGLTKTIKLEDTEALQQVLQFLYAECCTRNNALDPQAIIQICI